MNKKKELPVLIASAKPPAPKPVVVPSPPPQDALTNQAKKTMCRGLLSCYTKTEAWGAISIDVTAQVKGDGSVSTVKVGGTPPPKVRLCLAKTMKKQRIENYSLGPATARCIIGGNITPAARMVNFSAQFKLKNPPRATDCLEGDPLCTP